MGRRLRRILTRVLVLGVGATQAGCCCPGDDPSRDREYDRSSPAISDLIDRCAISQDRCIELCRAALVDELGKDARFYEVIDCAVAPRTDGAHVHFTYYDGSVCGRAPDGLEACEARAADPVTRWLARAAYLEAASVAAFVHLAADLVHHQAPRALIAGALAAARDEVRHATMMRTLCGIDVPVPRVAAYRRATLRELAIQNAIEGCARETVGAAINLWQAEAATDPRLRAVFASIARDEQAHAALAWAIHAWALPQLADTDEIFDAHRRALANLDEPSLDARLGLPSVRETRAIAAATARAFDTRRRGPSTRSSPGRSS